MSEKIEEKPKYEFPDKPIVPRYDTGLVPTSVAYEAPEPVLLPLKPSLMDRLQETWFFQNGRHLLFFGIGGVLIMLLIAGLLPSK